MNRIVVIIALSCIVLIPDNVLGQQQAIEAGNKTTTWLILQAIPSFSWTTFPSQTNFTFEWEATPVLYSFGMTKLVSPWHSFFVEPPARFTGSIELNVSGQVYTSSIGTTHLAYSGQLLGHIPLVERGEHLGINIGVAAYRLNNDTRIFAVGGLWTLFGFLHGNVKYAPDGDTWMTSLELRFF